MTRTPEVDFVAFSTSPPTVDRRSVAVERRELVRCAAVERFTVLRFDPSMTSPVFFPLLLFGCTA